MNDKNSVLWPWHQFCLNLFSFFMHLTKLRMEHANALNMMYSAPLYILVAITFDMFPTL